MDGKLFGTALIGSLSVVATQASEALGDTGWISVFADKGGLTALLAVLIYFYRRDWVRLNDTQAVLISKSHEVQQQTALALADLSDAVRDLKRPDAR